MKPRRVILGSRMSSISDVARLNTPCSPDNFAILGRKKCSKLNRASIRISLVRIEESIFSNQNSVFFVVYYVSHVKSRKLFR